MARLAYQIRYRDSDGERKWLTLGKFTKQRFDEYQDAADRLLALSAGWRHKYDPRIVAVRLKPRACRSEADIRREERERIAGALKPWRINEGLVLGDRVMVATTNTGDHTRQAREVLLAFDWPGPEKTK